MCNCAVHFISLRTSISSFFVSFHLVFVPHYLQYFFHSNFYPSSFITPCNIIFMFIISIIRPLVFLFPSLPFVNKITIEIKFDLPVSSSGTWPLWQLQLPPSAQLQWLSPHQPQHVQPQRLSPSQANLFAYRFSNLDEPSCTYSVLDLLVFFMADIAIKIDTDASILSFAWKAFHAGPSSLAWCVRWSAFPFQSR